MKAKILCRIAVVSALYVALTLLFAPFAFGQFQVRPAEALCLLPLLFPETVIGLFIGCALSNLASPFLFYDILFGATATLLAGVCTHLTGKMVRNTAVKITVGGIFPVLFNALCLPLMIIFVYGDLGGQASAGIAYIVYAVSIFCTQAVWVYGLGTPLYLALQKMGRTSKK